MESHHSRPSGAGRYILFRRIGASEVDLNQTLTELISLPVTDDCELSSRYGIALNRIARFRHHPSNATKSSVESASDQRIGRGAHLGRGPGSTPNEQQMTHALRLRPELLPTWRMRRNGTTIASWNSVEKSWHECKAAIDRIRDRPEQGSVDVHGMRSVRIQRFPCVDSRTSSTSGLNARRSWYSQSCLRGVTHQLGETGCNPSVNRSWLISIRWV